MPPGLLAHFIAHCFIAVVCIVLMLPVVSTFIKREVACEDASCVHTLGVCLEHHLL